MPKIVDKHAMRGRIMDAALICFRQNGYYATKMTTVARQAGLAKGTLYLYFNSKDELTVALLDRYFSGLEQGLTTVSVPDTLDGFIQALKFQFTPSPDQSGATRLLFDVLGPGFSLAEGREVIGRFFDGLAAHYARCLDHLKLHGEVSQDMPSQSTAEAIAAVGDGLVIHLALFAPGRDAYSKRLEAALMMLKKGLQVH